ncbi:MAG: methyltransferase [Lachnospiraceae bacterium]|nr:methyltransferase [Lachnospiraceae bacterium]
MSGPDSYYTPPLLADKLVSFIPSSHISRAVDFCVGDGALLKAVAKRYGDAELYGTDISDDALTKLSNDCPNWHLEKCDFRQDDSIDRIPFLIKRKFDLIVLNPPFTCKGSVVEDITFEGIKYRVSTAMLFLMRALKYLASNGGLYAILPISCVYSVKDREAWSYLKAHHNACILEESNKVSFTGKCAPNIVLVYVGHYKVNGIEKSDAFDFSSFPVTSILRGCVRMQNPKYSKSKDAVPLIHTTNLQKGELVKLKRIVAGQNILVNGSGVVIPRVCNPTPNKVALLDEKTVYALSDCIIVLRTPTRIDAERLRDRIIEHWCDFVMVYKGTGAQYTTLERLKTLFGMS